MKNFALVAGLLALIAAGAWAADYEVEPFAGGPTVVETPNYDGTVELAWDNGQGRWLIAYYTGAGTWIGNDFDISTIKTYPHIATLKMYSSSRWPNTVWEGFRLGVYAFSGGVPGSIMWGPSFVQGTGTGDTWVNFSVGWTLPSGVRRFLPAFEQYYNWPTCDPHLVDSNGTFLQHSWLYYGGQWQSYTNSTGYYNVMLRVIMDNEHNPGVSPSSIGRVKALYY